MFEEADETPEIETDTKADQEPQQEKEEEEEEVKVVVFVPPPGVTIVRDVETAKQVVSELRQLSGPNYFHACDTEVMDLDLNIEGPVGHGKCTCVSIYVGPDLDFGNGPRIWIDNLDEAEGLLQYFKDYFEDPTVQKVWHNYSFDRHILENHGIHCKGFAGDTMHMARLWDSARMRNGGYSLQQVSEDLLPNSDQHKRGMKERFALPVIKKDGTPGKIVQIPPIEQLQRDPKTRAEWIDYSTLDAEATWGIREILEMKLRRMKWQTLKPFNPSTLGSTLTDPMQNLPIIHQNGATMYDFYREYFVPFGELLVDMETTGIRIDLEKLQQMEPLALKDMQDAEKIFKEWASGYSPDAMLMNVHSVGQKQQLLFAPAPNIKTGEVMPEEKEFDIENTEMLIEEGKKKPKKKRSITLKGMGIEPISHTVSGWPAAGTDVLQKLAGKFDSDPPKYGPAYKHFGKDEEGAKACKAIHSLCQVGAISILLNTFIRPLQTMTDSAGRIHASLNINTETGRLSCRNPNLQNQPALEKDRYKVRSAFSASPGHKLIVADYGQLELRLLAHITNCQSMINAFKQGGDFHSRTAMGMYPAIAKAVESKEVLLEWNQEDGVAPAPLLKDVYASERRKAKVLNFSIAYGKTAHGLAKDWGVSMDEANDTLARWYADRPEVKEWQQQTIRTARETSYTRTLMGRSRHLPDIMSRNPSLRSHAERAAINTPLQGSAADVAMVAMLKLHNNKTLRDLGWKMLLQIHDELVFEGPEATTNEALDLIVHEMSHPFLHPLLVDLIVDASAADNWMEGK